MKLLVIRMRGVTISVLLIFISLLLTGCKRVDKIQVTYGGSNKDWHGEMILNAVVNTYKEDGKLFVENEHTTDLRIWYTGTRGIETVSTIEYFVTYTSGQTSGVIDEPLTYEINRSSEGNGAMLLEDEIISLVIIVDGEETVFDLYPQIVKKYHKGFVN